MGAISIGTLNRRVDFVFRFAPKRYCFLPRAASRFYAAAESWDEENGEQIPRLFGPLAEANLLRGKLACQVVAQQHFDCRFQSLRRFIRPGGDLLFNLGNSRLPSFKVNSVGHWGHLEVG